MKYFIIGLFATMNAAAIGYTVLKEDIDKSLVEGRYKQAIEQLNVAIQETGDTAYRLRLAEAYLSDQNLEESIKTYLTLLDEQQGEDVKGGLDSDTYRKALVEYLASVKPNVTAEKMIEEFSTYHREHPDDAGIGFLLSAAYANLKDYQSFYQTFYDAYLQSPNHYLAHKAKAALHIKLYERSKTDQEKMFQRKKIVTHTKCAMEQFNEDSTLYVWLITFCEDHERADCVKKAISQLVSIDRSVPRNDIPFYVQQAIDVEEFNLAQQFINKAKVWYQYSRIVEAAQNHLDQKKTH